MHSKYKLTAVTTRLKIWAKLVQHSSIKNQWRPQLRINGVPTELPIPKAQRSTYHQSARWRYKAPSIKIRAPFTKLTWHLMKCNAPPKCNQSQNPKRSSYKFKVLNNYQEPPSKINKKGSIKMHNQELTNQNKHVKRNKETTQNRHLKRLAACYK